MTLRLAEAASADLAELWAYLAVEASEAVATRFLDAIEAKLNSLCRAPGIGAKRDALSPGMRVRFHGAYAIYYVIGESELFVVRVLHGARDVRALAERGAFDVE